MEKAHDQGLERGIEQGREQGEKNKAVEIARRLKEKGIDIDIICETSGLSECGRRPHPIGVVVDV